MPPQKSQEELTALYHRNIDAVYRLCYVYLRNHADAEDAVQSVFLRYLQKRPEFHDMSHETAWLLLTAKNCCRDQLRTWWWRQRVDLDTLPEPTACTDAETRETLHILLSLPENIASRSICIILKDIRRKNCLLCLAVGKARYEQDYSGDAAC